jgi:hypothetical protein
LTDTRIEKVSRQDRETRPESAADHYRANLCPTHDVPLKQKAFGNPPQMRMANELDLNF